MDTPKIKGKRKCRVPSYAIYGNTFELRRTSYGNTQSELYKRYLVSTEFVQLFYKCLDGGFDNELFSELTDNEKFILSKALMHINNPENRAFNIAMSKFMKSMFERLKLIEMAVKAGNLSRELQNEYYTIIDKLVHAGTIKPHEGSYQKMFMRNTPCREDVS